jgi:GntR family transcriptional regulator, transcriptional repressor for pyruvate dehydrogenase complex
MSSQARAGLPPSSGDTFLDLESKIITGVFPSGSRLPSERHLAEQFGISRPGIREVLRRLQERGLIEVQAGRGSFVMEMNATRGSASVDQLVRRGEVTARDLVIARRMLEGEAAAQAAESRTDADAVRMSKLLKAFDMSEDLSLAAELDIAFHEAIAVASANPVLQIMFGSIRDLSKAMVLRSLADRRARKAGAPIHHEILRAIVRQNPGAARRAMTKHITLAMDHYGSDLDSPLASVLLHRADLDPEIAELLRQVSSTLTS